MKLTPEQINQIIEGLENRKTKLVATHLITLNITNVITKIKEGEYKNIFFYHGKKEDSTIVLKDTFVSKLKGEDVRHTLELVTKNKDKSETRIKI